MGWLLKEELDLDRQRGLSVNFIFFFFLYHILAAFIGEQAVEQGFSIVAPCRNHLGSFLYKSFSFNCYRMSPAYREFLKLPSDSSGNQG